MNSCAEPRLGKAAPRSAQETISESVAEDHARLLSVVGRRLAEVGIKAALTTFHNLVLYGDSFHLPSRYEPELDVFWREEERAGVALRVKLIMRDGKDFYAWGVSWARAHPASDPLGAVQIIADAVQIT
jgi:hypothetical protein